mmetsp:Transcript_49790/g.105882  ORF Transcript_49790/g.105882 Transcript_49790/m.105882 type:complete len:297 (-) Transcript_49790:1632-2522(-)
MPRALPRSLPGPGHVSCPPLRWHPGMRLADPGAGGGFGGGDRACDDQVWGGGRRSLQRIQGKRCPRRRLQQQRSGELGDFSRRGVQRFDRRHRRRRPCPPEREESHPHSDQPGHPADAAHCLQRQRRRGGPPGEEGPVVTGGGRLQGRMGRQPSQTPGPPATTTASARQAHPRGRQERAHQQSPLPPVPLVPRAGRGHHRRGHALGRDVGSRLQVGQRLAAAVAADNPRRACHANRRSGGGQRDRRPALRERDLPRRAAPPSGSQHGLLGTGPGAAQGDGRQPHRLELGATLLEPD